ncbi:MAG: O-antigen ligase family protein [bacterium]|nr:O-antigen ligase family protein [bacterium]
MNLQHGEIGFYTDVFSLVFIVAAAAAFVFLWYTNKSQQHQIDGGWWAVILIGTVSFAITGAGWMDCQPTVLIIGGGFFYLAARQHIPAANAARWFALLIVIAIVPAVWQYVGQQRLCAIFSNENYFAGFLAIAAPMLLGAALDRSSRPKVYAIAYGAVAALSVAIFALLRGRAALLGVSAGLAVMLMPMLIARWRKTTAWQPQLKTLRWMLIVGMVLGGCAVAVPAAHQLYLLKPISGAGRVLIWTVAARMVAHAPITGVGFGNFANTYNLFQADFFANGAGGVPQRMAADPIRHAFNEPLEVAAELGVPGLVLLFLLAGLILKEVWEVVRRNGVSAAWSCLESRPGDDPAIGGIVGASVAEGIYRDAEVAPTLQSDHRPPTTDYLTLGMAGSVVCFMVMSLFHFPRKVVPTWLVFNYALAWVVTVGQQCKQGINELNRSHKTLVVVGWRVFWFIAFVGSAALLPVYVKNYLDARHWIAAHELTVTGEDARAYTAYTELYPRLKWSGRFCAYYGNAIMAASENTNQYVGIDGNPAERAVSLYEKAKYTYPDPYMFENLAVVYLRLANGTSWPVFVQTQYRMETPAQTLVRRAREWRCGTNLFFEPPPTALTQSDCIGRAIDYLTLASNILPWRLTSRWYLAQVYRDVGDVSNAVKYAQLVVNIPMKKDTPQGRVFKRKAQIMLNELGVPCDDPGMVVFDIHDRKTWNEGKW